MNGQPNPTEIPSPADATMLADCTLHLWDRDSWKALLGVCDLLLTYA